MALALIAVRKMRKQGYYVFGQELVEQLCDGAVQVAAASSQNLVESG